VNRISQIGPFLVLAIAVFSAACTNPASKLPDYGAVPEFHMTNSHGQPFDSRQLAGKVWVADFIYTNCPAACPMMTYRMHGLEKKLRGENDVRLVSFSVDPVRDTPPVLNNFAHHYGGPTPQWIFLTGTPGTVHLLAYTTFHVGDVLGKIEHSTKFILVDKREHIRGYYSSLAPGGATGSNDIPALLNDISVLRG
jgi:protein SCO1/2